MQLRTLRIMRLKVTQTAQMCTNKKVHNLSGFKQENINLVILIFEISIKISCWSACDSDKCCIKVSECLIYLSGVRQQSITLYHLL